MIAVSAAAARALDEAAVRDYGLSSPVLVESAGMACARVLRERFPDRLSAVSGERPLVVLAGAGNNAADALCIVRRLCADQPLAAASAAVVLRSRSDAERGGGTAFDANLRALTRMGARILSWDADEAAARDAIRRSALVLDALSGTGLSGPLSGSALELARAAARSFTVAVDVPSGLGDFWRPGDPLVRADATLAIEPVKSCLFLPGARSSAGALIPVGGVFPAGALSGDYPLLVDFAEASAVLPPVPPDAYKHRRGVLDIYAGAVGSTGAATLAAAGAVAAGAGLVSLVVDSELWPILAPTQSGVMVRPADGAQGRERRRPDAILAGPGWGTGSGRAELLALLAAGGAAGPALVLDADAVRLAARTEGGRGLRFGGNAVLTPHLQEFADYLGLAKDEVAADPDTYALRAAAESGAVILLKGHVIRVAAPDGRLSYLDGMEPVLAMGGSGDVLAGLCGALCARERRRASETGQPFDPYPAAVAAAALLLEAARRARSERGFCQAADIAPCAGLAAAAAWLPDGGAR
jgi:NAD(P)H-hydrate epimerase